MRRHQAHNAKARARFPSLAPKPLEESDYEDEPQHVANHDRDIARDRHLDLSEPFDLHFEKSSGLGPQA